MILGNQKEVVRRLSSLAAARSRELAMHREVVRTWKRERIATPATMVWFFAAGALWGAGRSKESNDGAGLSRLAVGAANTSLLIWRFLNDTSIEAPQADTTVPVPGGDETLPGSASHQSQSPDR